MLLSSVRPSFLFFPSFLPACVCTWKMACIFSLRWCVTTMAPKATALCILRLRTLLNEPLRKWMACCLMTGKCKWIKVYLAVWLHTDTELLAKKLTLHLFWKFVFDSDRIIFERFKHSQIFLPRCQDHVKITVLYSWHACYTAWLNITFMKQKVKVTHFV